MARCNSKKCGCRTRIVSNAVSNMNGQKCFDVCSNPICGSPSQLGLFAPLIYDEIGINLCTTFDLGLDIPTSYPTASNISVQILDTTYTYGDGNVEITQISGRPNCYSVTLSNLCVTFLVNIFDDACRILDTIEVPVLYLPPDCKSPTYDEDTNPSSVELEIFAPYGVSFQQNDCGFTPVLNYIGFISTDNFVRQGLNLFAIPKVLNFNETESTATVGITLVLQSLYFVGYKVASAGKINIPKGCIATPEESDCMCFVAGDLLNLEIKPLQLGPPQSEEDLKQDCSTDCVSDCIET